MYPSAEMDFAPPTTTFPEFSVQMHLKKEHVSKERAEDRRDTSPCP